MTTNPARLRVMHSHAVDALLGQDTGVANGIISRLGGMGFDAFQDACFKVGTARIRSNIEADRLVYLIEVCDDGGDWHVLTRPTAEACGFEDTPELRDQELAFHAERLARELIEDEDR